MSKNEFNQIVFLLISNNHIYTQIKTNISEGLKKRDSNAMEELSCIISTQYYTVLLTNIDAEVFWISLQLIDQITIDKY